jgi:hypothetical protein
MKEEEEEEISIFTPAQLAAIQMPFVVLLITKVS